MYVLFPQRVPSDLEVVFISQENVFLFAIYFH